MFSLRRLRTGFCDLGSVLVCHRSQRYDVFDGEIMSCFHIPIHQDTTSIVIHVHKDAGVLWFAHLKIVSLYGCGVKATLLLLDIIEALI